jgi:hypothetical protein
MTEKDIPHRHCPNCGYSVYLPVPDNMVLVDREDLEIILEAWRHADTGDKAERQAHDRLYSAIEPKP